MIQTSARNALTVTHFQMELVSSAPLVVSPVLCMTEIIASLVMMVTLCKMVSASSVVRSVRPVAVKRQLAHRVSWMLIFKRMTVFAIDLIIVTPQLLSAKKSAQQVSQNQWSQALFVLKTIPTIQRWTLTSPPMAHGHQETLWQTFAVFHSQFLNVVFTSTEKAACSYRISTYTVATPSEYGLWSSRVTVFY